jgi:D-serine dehydratase
MPNSFLQSILDTPLDNRTKGIPVDTPLRLGDVGERRWNVVRGDMMLPILTLRQSRMRTNLHVMRDYTRHHGVYLAPHGKSTVCPQLYVEQMAEGGSWGITAATVQQTAVVAATGIPNIIIANQVVARANVLQLVALKQRYPDVAIYSLVDSAASAQQLVDHGRAKLGSGRFQVLLEVGYEGGRTGVRNMAAAREVLSAVRAHPDVLELCGIECYEGTINLPDAAETIRRVDAFLDFALAVLAEGKSQGAFRPGEVLLTAGGSAYFDRVVAKFTAGHSGPNSRIVLRGGSYLTYDHGFYEIKLRQLDARGGLAGPHGHITTTGSFLPALELWAMVQSLQDPGTAILAMGIRDLPYDLGYPRPLRQYREGRQMADEAALGGALKIVSSNDQHCYLSYPAGADIAVGDVFACGISHPCTAFDKWDVLYAVDEEFNVIGALKTFF